MVHSVMRQVLLHPLGTEKVIKWISEIKNPADASRGYFLGARLLDFLAPDNGQEKLVVPVSTEVVERKEKDGILDKDIIIRQTRAALSMLRVSNPDKIVTLGGECSVSVVPRLPILLKNTIMM